MHHDFLVVVVQLQRENGENYIITSLPNSEHKPDQLNAQISVIAENKPHTLHKTHLHTIKVVAILVPSLHSLR